MYDKNMEKILKIIQLFKTSGVLLKKDNGKIKPLSEFTKEDVYKLCYEIQEILDIRLIVATLNFAKELEVADNDPPLDIKGVPVREIKNYNIEDGEALPEKEIRKCSKVKITKKELNKDLKAKQKL